MKMTWAVIRWYRLIGLGSIDEGSSEQSKLKVTDDWAWALDEKKWQEEE